MSFKSWNTIEDALKQTLLKLFIIKLNDQYDGLQN